MVFSGKNTSSSHLTLCHYLSPASILIEAKSLSKEDILNELIVRLCKVSNLQNVDQVQKAVWDREQEGRTVLENGLAIPHARFEGIEDIKAAFAILPTGYEDFQEKTHIQWVFLFLSPQDQFMSHLQMLARISRVFQDKAFLEKLLQSKSSEEAYAFLQAKEASLD